MTQAEFAEELSKIFAGVLLSDSDNGRGVALHLVDLLIDELSKAFEEVSPDDDIAFTVLQTLLEPCFRALSSSNRILAKRTREEVFSRVLREAERVGEDVDEEEEFEEPSILTTLVVVEAGVWSDRLFAVASDPATPEEYRHDLYELRKRARKLQNMVELSFQLGEDAMDDDEDGHVAETQPVDGTSEEGGVTVDAGAEEADAAETIAEAEEAEAVAEAIAEAEAKAIAEAETGAAEGDKVIEDAKPSKSSKRKRRRKQNKVASAVVEDAVVNAVPDTPPVMSDDVVDAPSSSQMNDVIRNGEDAVLQKATKSSTKRKRKRKSGGSECAVLPVSGGEPIAAQPDVVLRTPERTQPSRDDRRLTRSASKRLKSQMEEEKKSDAEETQSRKMVTFAKKKQVRRKCDANVFHSISHKP